MREPTKKKKLLSSLLSLLLLPLDGASSFCRKRKDETPGQDNTKEKAGQDNKVLQHLADTKTGPCDPSIKLQRRLRRAATRATFPFQFSPFDRRERPKIDVRDRENQQLRVQNEQATRSRNIPVARALGAWEHLWAVRQEEAPTRKKALVARSTTARGVVVDKTKGNSSSFFFDPMGMDAS
ncbi:hypothetical protein TgHK011_003698 [Trichoderma gracile]|nr:hypothetical protein TgHK011_003698 [Trichoderma gracile]